MSKMKQRAEKLETGLTPKQAILLWLQDAHSFHRIQEYVRHLKDQPDSAWPIDKLTTQVEEAVKQRLKGRPREEISKAVRQAHKDVLFLFFLHQQVNGKLLTEERYYWTKWLLLNNELYSLLKERSLERQIRWSRIKVELEMPYPLDAETAVAIEAAKQHHVMTWEIFEEGDDVGGWLVESFIAKGKTALPDGAYRLISENNSSYSQAPTEDEVRDLFQDAESFQKFLAGEDYSYGLADVPDEEYKRHYEAIVCAIKGVDQQGFVVELPTVPHQFLREAPLLEGDWIDRYTVELAGWGARLVEKGHSLVEPEDQHPLAWHRIIDPEDGSESDAAVTMKLWQQTRKHLSTFSGPTREIDGRSYLSFKDYLKWRGRRNKGDLKSGNCTGLVVSQWNQWVEENGGEGVATLAGVKTGKLSCYLDGYRYRVSRNDGELAQDVSQRGSLLESLQVGESDSDDAERFRRRVERWKGLNLGFLPEIYTLRRAVDSINQQYFDGQQILFPSSAEGFDNLVALVEKTVDIYNDALAGDIERLEMLLGGQGESPLSIDRTGLVEAVRAAVVDQVAYMVDMAKAEALDLLGETRQAFALVDRHI